MDQSCEHPVGDELNRSNSAKLSRHAFLNESFGSSSESGSSSSSDPSSNDNDGNPCDHGGEAGNLLCMSGALSQDSFAKNSTSLSPANDMRGLVLEPLVVDADIRREPDFETDSSPWYDLVPAGSGGGVSVKARYLRGKMKFKEMLMLGCAGGKSSDVCLQIRFENR